MRRHVMATTLQPPARGRSFAIESEGIVPAGTPEACAGCQIGGPADLSGESATRNLITTKILGG